MSTEQKSHNLPKLTDQIGVVLSSSLALAWETQGTHWNVTGPNFWSLHEMFAEQYAELLKASDELAERIRALGAVAPAGLSAFIEQSVIPQSSEEASSAKAILLRLQKGHETLSELCPNIRRLADEYDDAASSDLLTQRAASHDKDATRGQPRQRRNARPATTKTQRAASHDKAVWILRSHTAA